MVADTSSAPQPQREISLYVHIPFCHYKCRYCSFYSVRGGAHDYDRFLTALANEWRLVREDEALDDAPVRVASLYVGGGTPSVLGPDRLERLLAILREGPRWLETCEVTLESNPESVSPELIGGAIAAGYNRVSVGAQSFDEKMLQLLGRMSTPDRVRAALDVVRSAGCRNMSIDLVYGLPGMTMQTWRTSFEEALHWQPEHLSAYQVTPEEETIFHQLLHADRFETPLDEDAYLQYEAFRQTLTEGEYEQYELSNFCRPGHRCRHHLDVWQRRPYYGLGPAAHSFNGEVRWCNAADLPGYLAQLRESPRRPYRERYRLSRSDEIRELILLGLRRAEGLTWTEIEAAGIGGRALERATRRARFLAGTGFMEIDDTGARVTPQAYFVAHNVFGELLQAIENETSPVGAHESG